MVTLASGELAATSDETTWDVQLIAADRERTRELSPDADLAGLGRVPVALPVYLVREGGALRLVVLPVWGAGYAATIWGYLALDGDLETVRAIQFYEHRETPGLGAEIDGEAWRQSWRGKRVRDETGALRIGVAKEALDSASADAPYVVDGITGATRTGRGVTNLLRFWLGPDGFGPFLARLAAQAGARP
jgi:Na+-transporting NADH:ubiquinone oxidoreductase subunit C